MKEKEINEVIAMSNVIVNKLGHKLYKEDYYSDHHYADEYEYEQLTIKNNIDDNYLSVKIGKEEVLLYNKSKNIKKVRDGKWVDLISFIYKNIPLILRRNELIAKKIRIKTDILLSLKEYIKFYVNCYNYKKEIVDIIDKDLLEEDIEMVRKTNYRYVDNRIQGVPDKETYYTFEILYKNHKVCEFYDGVEPFANMDYYVEKLNPEGKWIEKFKKVIMEAKNTDRIITQQKIDDLSNDMIKKFRNTL